MAFQQDTIVRKTFEVFSGLTGSMSETEFVEFCEISRGVCADKASKIFLVVAERPDDGMTFQEFEESLDLLIDLSKSSSRTCSHEENLSTQAECRGSNAVVQESSKITTRRSRQVLAPRVSCESSMSQRAPKVPVEVSKAPDKRGSGMALKVPRCLGSQGGFAGGSDALLSLKKASFGHRESASSTASTASSAGSDRSDISSVSSSPQATPLPSPRVRASAAPRLSGRDPTRTRLFGSRMSSTIR